MKYAQFQDPKIPSLVSIVGREDDDLERPFLQDVRISEWVEVGFPPRAPEEIVPAQLAALDREAEAVLKKCTDELHEIAERRATLLALTHESAA